MRVGGGLAAGAADHFSGAMRPLPKARVKRFEECLRRFVSPSGHLTLKPESGRDEPDLYMAFLAQLACDEIGAEVPGADGLPDVLEACRCEDGGYGSRPGMGRGVVSATSAALVLADRLDLEEDDDALEWLPRRQQPAGGFRATEDAPFADVLSTGVGLLALVTAAEPLPLEAIDAAEGFISEHWNDDGGFCGSLPDPLSDVEYTFYALLALGSLREMRGAYKK
jgi:prenyltransferase beta subunit